MRACLAAWITILLVGCATRPASVAPPPAPAVPVPGNAAAPAAMDYAALMVANATAMLGQPYRYGGDVPGGFDCSGLVSYAAGRAGVYLPRTTHEQIHAGVGIARRDLQAGDLVFMHLERKELHVGIAIDSLHFIHAPAAGGRVRIDSLSTQPYSGGFITARRVIGPGA
jgi:peptidoglycan DL-endopeptidase CwlO